MLDGRRLSEQLLDAIAAAVKTALEEVKNEAQRRAPVRKLFKGGGRRQITGEIGVHNQDVTGRAYFAARRIGRTSAGKYIRGAPNTSAPVTAPSRRSGRTPIGGVEFRELRRERGSLKLVQRNNPLIRNEILGRAKADIRRGRGVHVLPGGKAGIEYGGTLRDSIEVISPVRTKNGIVGYVKASATEHGFNYAYAQEFGTAHNAAQPYLRPALRAYLGRLRDRIGASTKDRLRGATIVTAGVRVTTSDLGIKVQFDPDFAKKVSRLSDRIDRAFAVR